MDSRSAERGERRMSKQHSKKHGGAVVESGAGGGATLKNALSDAHMADETRLCPLYAGAPLHTAFVWPSPLKHLEFAIGENNKKRQ